MRFPNIYLINGTAYAGKSTMVKLLAEKYGGIACQENYHDRLLPQLDKQQFPCLTYTRDLQDWREFIRRTPEQYKAWYDGVTKECETLELGILQQLCAQPKPVFVDTNLSVETMKTVVPPGHGLLMLAPPQLSVQRFFERPDREKQFLYRMLMEEPDPNRALENFRQCLSLVNSQQNYDRLLHAGLPVIHRDDSRSIPETLSLVEKLFGLAE